MNKKSLFILLLIGFLISGLQAQNCTYVSFEWEQNDSDACNISFTNNSVGVDLEYFWEFGDGSFSEETNPIHFFDASGCFSVKLTVIDDQGASLLKIEQVCFQGCGTDYTMNQNFGSSISGPTIVNTGVTFEYEATVVGGVPPYTYYWYVREGNLGCGQAGTSGTNPSKFIGFNGCSIGSNVEIECIIYDAANAESVSKMNVTVGGEIPDCKILVSGQPAIGQELNFRIAGSIFQDCYDVYPWWTWNFDSPDGQEIGPMGWMNYHTYSADRTYKVTATGCTDSYNQSNCVTLHEEVQIGPPSDGINGPFYDIFPEEQVEVNIGEFVELDLNLFNLPTELPNTRFLYYEVEWFFFDSYTGVELQIPDRSRMVCPLDLGDPEKSRFKFYGSDLNWGCVDVELAVYPWGRYAGFYSMDPEDCNAETCYGTTGICEFLFSDDCELNINCGAASKLSDNCLFDTGTPGCSSGYGRIVGCPYQWRSRRNCLIKVNAAPLEILDIISANQNCELSLFSDVSGGASQGTPSNCEKSYKKYLWKAYSVVDPVTEIVGFFDGDIDLPCVDIDENHEYFNNYTSSTSLAIKASLEVEDHFGQKDIFSKIIIFDKPLHINLPDEILRCPGTTTPLSLDELVLGSVGNIHYESPDLAFSSGPNGDNPTITTPGSSFNFDLIVTDENNCSTTKNIEVIVSPIVIDPGGGAIGCIGGPSGYRLGGEPTANGGSGSYSYNWQPEFFVRNNSIANPLPEVINQVTEFTVTVTDEYGCTNSASTEVTVEASANPIVDAGPDVNICFKAQSEIGNNPDDSNLNYEWSSSNPSFQTSTRPNAFLTSNDNSIPGIYTYNVKAFVDGSGCYAEDETIIEVHNDWSHKGYESEIVWAYTNQGKKLWSSTENAIYLENQTPNYNSGAVARIEFDRSVRQEDVFGFLMQLKAHA